MPQRELVPGWLGRRRGKMLLGLIGRGFAGAESIRHDLGFDNAVLVTRDPDPER